MSCEIISSRFYMLAFSRERTRTEQIESGKLEFEQFKLIFGNIGKFWKNLVCDLRLKYTLKTTKCFVSISAIIGLWT